MWRRQATSNEGLQGVGVGVPGVLAHPMEAEGQLITAQCVFLLFS